MQMEDDLCELAKVMKFMQAISKVSQQTILGKKEAGL